MFTSKEAQEICQTLSLLSAFCVFMQNSDLDLTVFSKAHEIRAFPKDLEDGISQPNADILKPLSVAPKTSN